MRRVRLHLVAGAAVVLSRLCAGQVPPPRPILYVNAKGGHAVLPDGHPSTLPGWEGNETLPVWSPTGALWAYARGDARTRKTSLEVRGWKTGPQVLFTSGDEAFSHDVLAWAPDGTRLATVLYRAAPAEEALAVFDATNGKLVSRVALPTDVIDPEQGRLSIQWSPDGRKILVADQRALVVDVARGSVDTLPADLVTAQWAPGGDGLYYFAGGAADTTRMGIRKVAEFYYRRLDAPASRLAERDQVVALGLEAHDPQGMWTASPSGTRLAVWASKLGESGADTSVVYLYDLSTTTPIALERPAHSVRIPGWVILRRVEWSPDERSVAMFGLSPDKGGGFEIRLLDAQAGTWRTVTRVDPGEDGADLYVMTNLRVMSWTQ